MANGFAGTGQSANRRRRRLSHEAGAENDLSRTPEDNAGSHFSSPVWKSEFDTQLLRKVLPSAAWVNACIAASFAVLSALTIFQMCRFDNETLLQIVPRVASCLLLICGQLTMLIGWIRSESDFDYRGRYRWWTILSVLLLAAAFLRLTDTTTLAAEFLISSIEFVAGPLASARTAVILVPLTTAGLYLCYRIIPDMQRCFESQALAVAAVLVFVVACGWQHLPLSSPPDSVIASMDVCFIAILFSSLLMHARYVAYVNHDPPVLIQKTVTEAIGAATAIDSRASGQLSNPKASEAAASEPSVSEPPADDPKASEKKAKPKRRGRVRRTAA